MKTLTASGYPCVLEGSAGMPVLDYKIYGNSVQDGIPYTENPIEIQSVGDLVTEGEYSEKYCVLIVTSGENQKLITTPIYLNEPLRKIGDYADVIDFRRGAVERKIKKIVFDGSETFQLNRICICNKDITTVESFKEHLTEQYDVGTPVTVYYSLAEPTTEPISIPSIPTFDGTTLISTDIEIRPANMEIKYKARK